VADKGKKKRKREILREVRIMSNEGETQILIPRRTAAERVGEDFSRYRSDGAQLHGLRRQDEAGAGV
jgi:hypothetical protein